MRLLFDENLPRSLRHHLAPYECDTVGHLGWTGVKNGKLLSLAEESGFDWLITLDDDLPPEQNLTGRNIKVIILKPERQGKSELYKLAPKIITAIENSTSERIVWISPP